MTTDGFYVSDTMCRACLRRDGEKQIFSVHKPTAMPFSSILKSCVSLEVDPNDGLPKNICLKCLKLLVSFYKFKCMVIENDTRVRKVLNETQQVQINNHILNQNVCLNAQEPLYSFNTNPNTKVSLTSNNIDICYIENINYTVEPTEKVLESTKLTPKDISFVTDSESSSESNKEEDKDHDHDKRLGNSNKRRKIYQCEICEKVLSSKGNLNQHIRTHTGERPYSCDVCEKKFFKAEHVLIHKRIHTGERPHKCLICSKRFIQYVALKAHLRTHSGERSQVCSICGKSFGQSSSLVYHMRTHSGETPYVCTLCNKGFKNPGNLNIHMRFHQNERNYICHICDKRFVTSSHLNVHIKQHNGEKPHKCVVCGKAFVRSEHLKIHLVIHSGQKPYYCVMCPRRFTQSSHLKRHVKKIHQQDTQINQTTS